MGKQEEKEKKHACNTRATGFTGYGHAETRSPNHGTEKSPVNCFATAVMRLLL